MAPKRPRLRLVLDIGGVLGATLVALTLPLWIHGCEGTVGPCAGEGCPHVPGCEGDNPVTCDPDHICTEQVCDGVAWICGVNDQGEYQWLRSSAPCDDGDGCTENDLCINGACSGMPRDCDQPPPNECASSTTLRAWASGGFCQDGKCNYSSSEIPCPQGCQAGKCIGSPCTGVTCDNPPECFQPGVCNTSTGKCSYDPQPAGTSCDPNDPCVQGATCDAEQKCQGGKVDCSRPNTTGGTCVSGACQGFQCTSGFGNCDSSWDNGCETQLDSDVKNCGKCGTACGSVAHGSPSCSAGKCVAKCNSPYKDCDKEYANGCEIPVGQANKCSRSGLESFTGSTPPCGTPYCGDHATDDNHKGFGTWHCKFCVHCYMFTNGGSWCLKKPNGEFSSERCSTCCNPSSHPQKCK